MVVGGGKKSQKKSKVSEPVKEIGNSVYVIKPCKSALARGFAVVCDIGTVSAPVSLSASSQNLEALGAYAIWNSRKSVRWSAVPVAPQLVFGSM